MFLGSGHDRLATDSLTHVLLADISVIVPVEIDSNNLLVLRTGVFEDIMEPVFEPNETIFIDGCNMLMIFLLIDLNPCRIFCTCLSTI